MKPRPFEEWIKKGHQRDANLCGACARPTDERSFGEGRRGVQPRLLCILAPTQHSCMQPHLTPTSSPPTPLHLIAISPLAIHCLSPRTHLGWSQPTLRTELPSTSTQPTPFSPANTQPPHAGCEVLADDDDCFYYYKK